MYIEPEKLDFVSETKPVCGSFSEKRYEKMYRDTLKRFLNSSKKYYASSDDFDEKHETEIFEYRLRRRCAVLSTFPEEILRELKNFNFLVLGYCHRDEKAVLVSYCLQTWKKRPDLPK